MRLRLPSFSTIIQSAALLAALLLLLPTIGPLLDHHFVERLPTHDHLLLGAQPQHSHTHVGSQPHAHPGLPDIPSRLPRDHGDILFFGSHDGWTPPAYSAAPLFLLAIAALLGAAAALTWSRAASPLFAESADLPPPKNPPRRSLHSSVVLM